MRTWRALTRGVGLPFPHRPDSLRGMCLYHRQLSRDFQRGGCCESAGNQGECRGRGEGEGGYSWSLYATKLLRTKRRKVRNPIAHNLLLL